jgi:hypothetical protein
MSLALIAAVVSMVVAVIATIIAVVGHQEMGNRNRRLSISGVVVGAVATFLNFCLNHEVIRPTLMCVAYILTILCLCIVTMVTGVSNTVTSAVLQWKRQRR